MPDPANPITPEQAAAARAALDAAIVAKIAGLGRAVSADLSADASISAQMTVDAAYVGRPKFRSLEAALQRLRKAGKIAYTLGRWVLVKP